MKEIEFQLEVFTGPLDLLLHLISKHQLNIYDIEITRLLEQYLLYMEQAREQNLDLAGEFLEMAARLIYIKTVSLLPRPEEAERAKQELQGSLIEFALCKKAAFMLGEQFIADDIFVRKPMKFPKLKQTYKLHHTVESLADIWAHMDKSGMNREELSKKITDTVMQEKVVSVASKVVHILRRLWNGEEVLVSSLYEGLTDRSARVATFLAVLELTRFGRIMLNDDNTILTIRDRKEGENGN
ncbi:MAG TPA: chromosome segregation protein ScpA [Ruminococcus sp.]|nr:chromosome segregation protein ScpA [Ruminococcus sp.]